MTSLIEKLDPCWPEGVGRWLDYMDRVKGKGGYPSAMDREGMRRVLNAYTEAQAEIARLKGLVASVTVQATTENGWLKQALNREGHAYEDSLEREDDWIAKSDTAESALLSLRSAAEEAERAMGGLLQLIDSNPTAALDELMVVWRSSSDGERATRTAHAKLAAELGKVS